MAPSQQHQPQGGIHCTGATRNWLQQGEHPAIDYVAVGRKGRDFVVRNRQHLMAEFVNYGDRPSLEDAAAIAQVAR